MTHTRKISRLIDIKKQIRSIFKQVNTLNEADRNGVFNYIQKLINFSHQTLGVSITPSVPKRNVRKKLLGYKVNIKCNTGRISASKQSIIQPSLKCYKCPYCLQKFRLQRHLDVHIKVHKGKACSYCDTVLTNGSKCMQRIPDVHEIKLNCIKTKSNYYGKGTVKRKGPYNRYKCITCNENCKYTTLFHKQRGHLVRRLKSKFYCPCCSAMFKRSLLLLLHINQHKQYRGNKGIFKCKFCRRHFNTTYKFFKHCKTVLHNEKLQKYRKILCKRRNNRLRKKLAVLQDEPQFRINSKTVFCKYCNYKTPFKTNMKRHINLHFSIEKHFTCDYCGSNFTSKAVLNDHINYNHILQEKKFKCEECSKSFKRNSELIRHMSCHSDARPHACNVCNQTYKRISHLKRHQLSSHSIINKTNKVQRLRTDHDGTMVSVEEDKPKSKIQKQSPAVSSESSVIDNCFELNVSTINSLSSVEMTEQNLDITQVQVLTENNFQGINVVDYLIESLQIENYDECSSH